MAQLKQTNFRHGEALKKRAPKRDQAQYSKRVVSEAVNMVRKDQTVLALAIEPQLKNLEAGRSARLPIKKGDLVTAALERALKADAGYKVLKRRAGDRIVIQIAPGPRTRTSPLLEPRTRGARTPAQSRVDPQWTTERYLAAPASDNLIADAGDAIVRQMGRAARLRKDLATEFGLLRSSEVAEFAGSFAQNKAATANRWAKAGRIFSVPTGQGERFPGFEFRDGVPRLVVQSVVSAFGQKLTGWSLALWFTSSNGWLNGQRPVDLLDDAPSTVIEAAERAAAEIL